MRISRILVRVALFAGVVLLPATRYKQNPFFRGGQGPSRHVYPLTETMKITQEEVQRVAALARLELSADEVVRMTGQLDRILSYVAKLDELDTTGVAPTTHTQAVVNAFREDEVRPSLSLEQALANAAEHSADAFVVPRVIG